MLVKAETRDWVLYVRGHLHDALGFAGVFELLELYYKGARQVVVLGELYCLTVNAASLANEALI